jgi:hypothetical protein
MASQSNIMSFRNDPAHRKMAYLSVKRSAPFRISGRPMKVGHYGRNPALLMPKTESTSAIPGGPNLMCCCARLPNFRWRPGLDWKGMVVAIRHSACPRWNPPPTYAAVLISCVVVTAWQIFAGGGSAGRAPWSPSGPPAGGPTAPTRRATRRGRERAHPGRRVAPGAPRRCSDHSLAS